MTESREYHTKWSKTDRYHGIIYMQNLKNNTNESTFSTERDWQMENRLMVSFQTLETYSFQRGKRASGGR